MNKLWSSPRTNKTNSTTIKYAGGKKSRDKFRKARKRRKPKGSKLQTKLAHLAKAILKGHPKYHQEATWPWLLSPKQAPMFVDIYFPSLKLCIELNGPQHYNWPNRFHRTKKAFEEQLKRDKLKKKLLKEHGYTVIVWPHTTFLSKRAVYLQLKELGYEVEIPPRAKPGTRKKKKRKGSRKHKLLRMS